MVFGPKPRDYRWKLPQKVRKLALRRAFSERVAAGEVLLLEELRIAEPKTRLFYELLKKLSLEQGALFIVDRVDHNLFLASRNVPGVAVVAAKDVNTYQMLRYRRVGITTAGMQVLKERLSP